MTNFMKATKAILTKDFKKKILKISSKIEKEKQTAKK